LANAGQKPAYAVAVRDFFTPPTVDAIELSAYRGRFGDRMVVVATDDAGVISVDVAIKDMTGAVLERGRAQRSDGRWIYTATADAPAGQALTVEVTATDRPGNTGAKSVPWVPMQAATPVRHPPGKSSRLKSTLLT
jgi:hypothetical protein